MSASARRSAPARVARAACALALASAFSAVSATADAPAWRVEKADVRVVCPLTVGGSFEAHTHSLAGTLALASAPPTLAGEITVDLRTLETGIGLRDRHLRDEYLEVGRGPGFDSAVLSDLRLDDADGATFQGRTRFTATLLVHGEKAPVHGQAEVRRDGGSVRVEASFPLTLADHGIARPQYLGVGVRDEIQVKVSFLATPVASAR